jgi:putative NIF3 family GTP cyclohydrolase 1 type 2
VKETLRYKVGQNVDFCKIGSVLVFAGHNAEETSDLKQQVERLGKKHELEVTLSTAQPEK